MDSWWWAKWLAITAIITTLALATTVGGCGNGVSAQLSSPYSLSLSPTSLSSPFATLSLGLALNTSLPPAGPTWVSSWSSPSPCQFTAGPLTLSLAPGPPQTLLATLSLNSSSPLASSPLGLVFSWREASLGDLFDAQVSLPPLDWSYQDRVTLSPTSLRLDAVFAASASFPSTSLTGPPLLVRYDSGDPVLARSLFPLDTLALPTLSSPLVVPITLDRGKWTSIPLSPGLLLFFLVAAFFICCVIPCACAFRYYRKRRSNRNLQTTTTITANPDPDADADTSISSKASSKRRSKKRRRRSSISSAPSAPSSSHPSISSFSSDSNRSCSISLITEDWLSTTSESLQTSDFI